MRFVILSLLSGLLLAISIPCISAPVAGEIASATLTLTVTNSILMALENNRALAVERYGPDILESFVTEEEASFDPSLQAQWSSSETHGQRTSGVGEFTTVESIQRTTTVDINKRTTRGWDVGLEASAGSRSSNVYRRMFSTRLGVSLNVPLMEAAGKEVNLVGVRQAQQDTEISRQELRGFVLELAAQVEENYWDLVLAREELNIHLTSLDLARQQMEETQARIEVGDLPEIDIAAAEGEVALRDEDVIDAESTIQKTTLLLLRSLNPPMENLWSLPIDLVDTPNREEPILGDIQEQIRIALENRPDLNQAHLELERNELEIVRTRNGLLPKLDFFITLGRTGYARTFDDSVRGLEDPNFELLGGFLFEHPLGNRADHARHRRADLRVEESKAALQNLEQLIELDVRTAYVEVERTGRQIQATQTATRLQEAKHTAEVEKFRVGKSTNLLVLVAQRDLIQSNLDEVRARIQQRKALVDLYRSEGILLDRRDIVIPSDTTPVIPTQSISDPR
ncbi:MAG TPA: TolC family protein [bacterium]|nr:TolC family protein [bacterium]HPO07046.1 TolC family protein [bacterium]